MTNPSVASLVRLVPVVALCSCAAPKAIVAEETKPAEQKREIAAAPEISEPAPHPMPEDDFRMPDMLSMPGEDEFRSAAPTSSADAGAVIVRPPTEPPPRRKPQVGE